MDTFSSSGIAQGIFHEYLRGDDPISMEARNNFAEGFPFLLAPLAQVKVPSMGVLHPSFEEPTETANVRLSWIAGTLSVFGNAVIYQQNKFLSWLDNMITEATNKFVQLTISLEQYKEQESDRLGTILQSLYRGEGIGLKSHTSMDLFQDDIQNRHVETGRLLSSFPLPTSDEVAAVNSRPKMSFSRRIFIITVHFYLLLLLIACIPDSFPTKVVVTKKCSPLLSLDSESDNDERNEPHGDDDSVDSLHLDLKHFEAHDIIADCSDELLKKPMKKALSYCL